MKRILLAASGGIDSMYLANRAPELFPGARFAVAHCNFSLRGAESDADEAFVRNWCRERDWPCLVRRFDTRSHAAAHGISSFLFDAVCSLNTDLCIQAAESHSIINRFFLDRLFRFLGFLFGRFGSFLSLFFLLPAGSKSECHSKCQQQRQYYRISLHIYKNPPRIIPIQMKRL